MNGVRREGHVRAGHGGDAIAEARRVRVRRRGTALGVAVAIVLGVVGCSGPRDPDTPRADTGPAASGSASRDASTPVERPRIVALGDSLTAGYGLAQGEAYPERLQERVDAEGLPFEVVNMGVSGDTSAGGLRRVDWALEGDVRVLILALGGNDGLRGLSPADLEANLAAIIDRAQAQGARVLLCGMQMPPNLGPQYVRAFREVYPRLAREKDVELVPFLLDGVAGVGALNQPDGIHPTAEGARRIADVVWAHLEPMLQDAIDR
jgi:acyl-CoA thioesterase-1